MIEVIMLSYNNLNTIKRAIDSILVQELDEEVTISIFDNYSTDGSRIFIDELCENTKNIKKHYRDKNIGFARNFIASLEESSGDFIAFLDADDYWTDKHKLQKQVDVFRKNPHVAVVHTSGIIKTGNEERILRPVPATTRGLLDKNLIIWQTVMINGAKKNAAIAGLNHYYNIFRSEPIPCDYIILMELAPEGITKIDDITAVHEINTGSVSHPQGIKRIITRHYRTARVRLDYCKRYRFGFKVKIMIIVRTLRRCFLQIKEKNIKQFSGSK